MITAATQRLSRVINQYVKVAFILLNMIFYSNIHTEIHKSMDSLDTFPSFILGSQVPRFLVNFSANSCSDNLSSYFLLMTIGFIQQASLLEEHAFRVPVGQIPHLADEKMEMCHG